MSNYFYGWYFRCQGKDGSAAVIPAVHLSDESRSCSIQVITQSGSLYREFPVSLFRIDRKKGWIQIGRNVFSRRGIRLSFDAYLSEEKNNAGYESGVFLSDKKRVKVSSVLRFGEFSRPKYNIMGPFAYIPGMECRHAVYSMKHTVDGELKLNDKRINFQNAIGYAEGDSGISFPDQYIWTQHFFAGGSIMAAAASIPLMGLHFTGTIGFLYRGNKEYCFATYLGAKIKRLGDRELLLRQGGYRLYIRLLKPEGSVLRAPEGGRMLRRVREAVACQAEYVLIYKGRVLFHVKTDKAAAEYDIMK